MNGLDFVRRHSDLVDGEAMQRVGDRHDAVGEAGQSTFDKSERTDAEGVVVVLRGDKTRAAQACGDSAIDVGVHEVRVHDVRAQCPRKPYEQQGVEVTR